MGEKTVSIYEGQFETRKPLPNCEGKFNLHQIGERIRIARKVQSNETQEDLGIFLGVGRRSVAKYERGFERVPINTLVKISEHYDVSLLWLLGLE